MPGAGDVGGCGGKPLFIQPDGEQKDAIALVFVFAWADAQPHAFALKGGAVGEAALYGFPADGLQVGDEGLSIRHTPLGREGVAILHPDGEGYIEVAAGDVQKALNGFHRGAAPVPLCFS